MKRFIIGMILLLLVFGCSSLQPKRELLPGNIFNMTNPDLTLKASDEFKYKGGFDNTKAQDHKYGQGSAKVKKEYHAFLSNDGLVLIYIGKITDNSRWLPLAKKKSFVTEIESVKIGKKYWQTYIRTINPSAVETQGFLSIGVQTTSGIAKCYYRNATDKVSLIVFYLEDRSQFGKWNGTHLTSNQSDFLEEFLERADKAFDIVK